MITSKILPRSNLRFLSYPAIARAPWKNYESQPQKDFHAQNRSELRRTRLGPNSVGPDSVGPELKKLENCTTRTMPGPENLFGLVAKSRPVPGPED